MLIILKKGILNGKLTMRQDQFIKIYLVAAVNRCAQLAGSYGIKCSQ